MKHCLPLLKLSCIFLIISACAGQSMMLKKDFPQQGISLVLPSDSSYETELQKLGFSGNVATERVRPASVVIKNTSQHTIIAFGISWTKRHLKTGTLSPSSVSCSQSLGLLDGNRRHYDGPLEGTIPPGTSRLVTVAGMIQTASDLGKTILNVEEWRFEEVLIDSVVFEDGEAFGPDHLDVAKRLQARVDALQELTQEISNNLSQGGQLGAVLEGLTSVSPSQSEMSVLSPFNPGDVRGLVRQQYLEELAATAKNAGEDVARRRLRQLMYTTRPTIRRVQSGGR